MYENILIPTDGSLAATQAAEQAFGLAELCGATVHILHVVQATSSENDSSYSLL